jgi:hypothetical protein
LRELEEHEYHNFYGGFRKWEDICLVLIG